MLSMIMANILGPDAIIIAVLAIVLLFGAGQLPKLARSVGEASKEFKKVHDESKTTDPSAAPDTQSPSTLATSTRLSTLGVPVSPEAVSNDKITVSRSELDAMIAEREAHARSAIQPPPSR